MRLINVKTFELEDFLDYKAPPYAILSHTWGDDSEELTLRDVETGRTSKPGVGSVKFQGSCRQAEKDGLGYIWIDTCCIDKTNLVELSEAINSMFRWYRNASVCYAYLSDVPARDNDYAGEPESKFRASRWFGRGWTLQELLAPKRMRFYNSAWSCLGTKGKLWTVIGEITGIPCPILLGITNLRSASVAQRMSWAAGRETKRKEDLAYCLLGIFGVTMPMIYGEGGDQAFFRLQEQIMKMTRDDSILAWGFTSNEQSSDSDPGQVIAGRALATTPSDFANSGHIVCREQSSTSLNSVEISGGNLRLYLSLLATSADNRAIGLLHCGPDHDPQLVTGIPLAKTAPGTSDEYVRPVGWHAILQPRTSTGDSPRLIYIRNDSQSRISPDASRKAWLYHAFAEVNLDLVEVNPRSCWDQDEALIISRTSSSWIMARFRYHEEESPDFLVLLEFKQQGASAEPRCHVMICRKDLSLQELARKLESVPKTAFGKESASNGLLHLSVTLKPNTEQLVFIMQPKSLSHPPEVTVDATAELQKSDITLALIKILQEKSILDTKAEDLHQTEQEEKNRLEQIKIEREKVEDELRELEERRRTLAKDESDLTENIHSLSQSQMTFIGIQEHTFGRWLVARKRWDQFWHIERDKSSYDWDRMLDRMADETPLRWAAEGGHDLIVQQLLDEGADAQARDVDGRTALSYAVERRHETVVQLLLESGQTPLGWTVAIQMAAKGNHEAILQLLGAPTDRFFKKNPKFLQAVAIGALTLAEMPSTPFSNKDLLPLSFQVAIHQQVMYCVRR
ncbi:heterokaryon incompatibility protein-domain-containing protein [Poronia punctata]|nr:heterokaryon incompatibility protein-domain-containing protein [Poronia punctata]